MFIQLSVILSLLSVDGVRAMDGMKAMSCEGRKCSMDVSGFKMDQAAGEKSTLDLGPGQKYECTSMGAPMGEPGMAYHGECVAQGKGKKDIPGAMNAIYRGKNAAGEDMMFASMSMGGDVCRMGPDATGTETVMECTPADEFPPEDEGADPRAQDHELGPPEMYEKAAELAREKAEGSPKGLRGTRGLQTNDIMDIMVAWTRKAECRSNGLPVNCALEELNDMTTANIKGLIELAVFETNTAYANSGITAELRLVHSYREETYDESAGASAALEAITFDNDGFMDDVFQKRQDFGADLVALIGSEFTTGGICGVAWVGPSFNWMFSATDWTCATGQFTFGHEIGHNMGCLHDKGNAGDCGNTDFNYGYKDPQTRLRTILGTDCRSSRCPDQASIQFCPRVQYFSNTVNQVNGIPLGNATIDNARRINSVSATIANFLPEVPQCTQDSDCDDNDPCTTNVCDGACVFDPIDCDDGNACTEDSCSAGTCVNTDISSSCDDGNPCTADICDAETGCSSTPDTSLSCDDGNICTNDSCGEDGTCSSEPIMGGCCGNGICEDGEQGTCPADCSMGPFVLPGPLCGSCFGLEGNMFDVVATGNDVTISTFRIRYFQGSTVEVWTRPGTHNGFQFSSAGWTRVASYSFSATRFTFVEIPASSFTQTVTIPAGERQAFYVTMTWGDVIYHRVASSLTAVAAQDDNLIMFEGPAKLYPFGGQTGPRVFNGQIVYVKGGAVSGEGVEPIALGASASADEILEEEVAVERELVGEESAQ